MFELKQKETSEDRANLVVVCAGILQSSNTQESAANKGRGQALDVINDMHNETICKRGCRRMRIKTNLRISFNDDVSQGLRDGQLIEQPSGFSLDRRALEDRFYPNFDDYSIMVKSHGSYGSFEIKMCSVDIDLNTVDRWGGPTQMGGRRCGVGIVGC